MSCPAVPEESISDDQRQTAESLQWLNRRECGVLPEGVQEDLQEGEPAHGSVPGEAGRAACSLRKETGESQAHRTGCSPERSGTQHRGAAERGITEDFPGVP